jgi:hypothetical protein
MPLRITDALIKARLARIPAAVFISFASFYALLRSKNILAVDGAHRCLEVFRRQGPFFHGNNHMLYPVDVLVWTRLVAAVGLRPTGPIQFFSNVELMNCLAGAACLAILYFLMSLAVSPWWLALSITVGYGFSKAFLTHATNAGEPVVGVFWSFLAIFFAVLSFKVRSNWPIVVSGYLFSVAMATYQSTIFLAPAAIVLLLKSRATEHKHTFFDSTRCLAIGVFALGGLLGGMLIYGWAYRLMGITSLAGMLKRFFVLETGQVFFGAGVGKSLNVPVGMIRNIFPVLGNYVGIRDLLAGPRLSLACFLLLLLLFSGFLVLCFSQVYKRWTSLPSSTRTGFISASVGLAFTIIPLLVWEPNYDKLWLQPLACLAYLLALALSVIRQETQKLFQLYKIVAALFLAGVLSNSVWAVQGHRNQTPGMQEAQMVAETVGKGDMVVGGWNNVSILYGDIWAGEGQYMDFTSEAVSYGRGATTHLREAVLKTQRKGGRVYFLGVVDVPKQDWDSYLGSKCGVPFSDMDFYRAHSNVLGKLESGSAEISFSQLDSTSLN